MERTTPRARLLEMADAIEGTDAAAILLDRPYRSFCNGSDRLVSLGLWDEDGQINDDTREVRSILRSREVLS